MALGDRAVDVVPVVRAVAGERGDRARRPGRARGRPASRRRPRWPVSSTASIRPVSASTPRCSLRQDRRVFVPCFSTSHSPGPHSCRPVLSTSRCTRLRCRSVAAAPPSVSARRLRVVWSGTASSRPSRRRIGADQPLGLAQGQAEHGPQRQRRQDRQGRVVRLPARGRARLRPPGRDRLLGEPDRQAPALAQGGVVLGPVRDPVPLLGDVVTASGVGLERHGGIRGSWKGPVLLPHPAPAPTRRSVQHLWTRPRMQEA